MILCDTSAWVRHLRSADLRLARLLRENRVVTCDVVLGELLLGSGLPPELTEELARLPSIPVPSAADTRAFIARHLRAVQATGVGWADVQLVAAAVDAGALVYTADGPIKTVWRRLGLRPV